MKKLRPVFLAVVVGCSFAFILFKTVEVSTDKDDTHNAVAIQIGVFTDEENALAMTKSYGGLVFRDDDLYRVYYSILNNDENISFMTGYLDEKGINYYLKNIRVEDDIIDKSYKYETMMKSTNKESKLSLNTELLNIYKEVV